MLRRVLLYGNSIFLGGLAAQLQGQDNIDVIQQTSLTGPLSLGDFDAIIVDFNNVGADDVLAIMRARPDIKIVGVNTPGSAVTVFSGKVYLARTLTDVVGCLET